MMIYHVHSGVLFLLLLAITSTQPTRRKCILYVQVLPAILVLLLLHMEQSMVLAVLFPGTGAKTSFTDATTPNMKSWAAANTAKPITLIAENATTKVITFAFMGGATTATAPLNLHLMLLLVFTSGATLQW